MHSVFEKTRERSCHHGCRRRRFGKDRCGDKGLRHVMSCHMSKQTPESHCSFRDSGRQMCHTRNMREEGSQHYGNRRHPLIWMHAPMRWVNSKNFLQNIPIKMVKQNSHEHKFCRQMFWPFRNSQGSASWNFANTNETLADGSNNESAPFVVRCFTFGIPKEDIIVENDDKNKIIIKGRHENKDLGKCLEMKQEYQIPRGVDICQLKVHIRDRFVLIRKVKMAEASKVAVTQEGGATDLEGTMKKMQISGKANPEGETQDSDDQCQHCSPTAIFQHSARKMVASDKMRIERMGKCRAMKQWGKRQMDIKCSSVENIPGCCRFVKLHKQLHRMSGWEQWCKWHANGGQRRAGQATERLFRFIKGSRGYVKWNTINPTTTGNNNGAKPLKIRCSSFGIPKDNVNIVVKDGVLKVMGHCADLDAGNSFIINREFDVPSRIRDSSQIRIRTENGLLLIEEADSKESP